MTQKEKTWHTQRLTDAVEKLKKSSRQPIKCGTSPDKAHAAAVQRGRKKMGAAGDASNQTAELVSHALWSRKYQPCTMSEVTSQHS